MAEDEIKATTPAQEPMASQKKGDQSLRVLHSWVRDLCISILISLFIILFVYQPVKVEGGSMEPGLEDQERIFINKLVYRIGAIGRGDIIVFRYPRDLHKNFIKRVIGIPGDRIRINHGRVYVNG